MNERVRYQERPSRLQIETYRSWGNVRKMRCMFELFELAKHRARMAVRVRHPDWDDERVERRVRELVTGQALISEREGHG